MNSDQVTLVQQIYEAFTYGDVPAVLGRLVSEWDNFSVHPQPILATPVGAVALGRYSGTYKKNGRRVDAQFAIAQ